MPVVVCFLDPVHSDLLRDSNRREVGGRDQQHDAGKAEFPEGVIEPGTSSFCCVAFSPPLATERVRQLGVGKFRPALDACVPDNRPGAALHDRPPAEAVTLLVLHDVVKPP